MNYRKMVFTTLVVAVMAIPISLSSLTTSDGSSISMEDSNINIEGILESPVIILDVSDLSIVGDTFRDELSLKVLEGKPLLVNGDIDELGLSGIPQSSGSSPDVSGVYYNDDFGATCMFTASGVNAMENAQQWANSIASEVETRGSGGDSDFCWFDGVVENTNFKIYARSDFTKLGTMSGETYYLIHHYINPIVKNTDYERETSEVTVIGDISNYDDSRIVITGPNDSVIPDQSGSMSVGIDFSQDGLSFSISNTWNYISQYSTIDNDTDLSEGIYTISTDFNEEDFVIDDMMILEPGALIAVNSGSTMQIDLTFNMEVRQKYANKFWPWDPVWEYRSLEFSQNVSIDP